MNNVWVILDETKEVILEVFETQDPNSKPHWDKFFHHKAGCVFCGRPEINAFNRKPIHQLKWYYNYFYWEDQSRWGYSDPDGIGWSAAMTVPEVIKMLELVGGN